MAHDLWLERHDEGLVLLYGHTGRVHGQPDTVEYDPEEVLRVECYSAEGEGGEIAFERSYPLILTDTCAVTYVLTSSGCWTETPFGTKRLPKSQAKAPLRSWLSYESVKRIDGWSKELSRPVTDDLELSPVKDPLGVSVGKKVRLLVTVGGRPRPGLPVAYDGEARGVTDCEGRINIRLRHGGLQMIQTSYSEPGDSIKTDEIIRTTTLIFEIPVEANGKD